MGKINNIMKWDGWQNIFTALGVQGKDKCTGLEAVETYLTQAEVDPIYQVSDVAARIIDRPAEEMCREGFTATCEGQPDFNDLIQDYFKRFQLWDKIQDALKYKSLYGGAGIVVGAQDGTDPSQPVNFENIKTIEFFTMLDRYRLRSTGGTDLDADVKSKNFQKPLYYTLQSIQGNQGPQQGLFGVTSTPKIHWTRVVRFQGVQLGWLQMPSVDYWGDSVLSRLLNPIKNYQSANDSVALMLQDATQMVIKLKNLADMIAQGNDDLVLKRFSLLSQTASIVNAIVIEDGEEAERKTTSLTGIPEAVAIINKRLVAATDIPHTILLGESPSGLGASGDSEMDGWYAHIKNKQKKELEPVIKELINFICLAKDGPTKGQLKPYTIEWNPLYQLDEVQTATLRKMIAETDQIYIQNEVTDPDEIAQSRFGSGKYSTETHLNTTVRAQIAKTSYEDPAGAQEMGGEAASGAQG